MRRWIRPLLVIVLVGFVPLPAWSIIIETKDGKVHRGHLIEQNALRVTIRPDGKKEPVTFERTNIEKSFRFVDENRLKDLKPSQLNDYFNYAKQLAAERDDPEARDMALRLFSICAYKKPTEFGYKSLLAMSKLARTSAEERSFRAMAFLLDLLHDKDLLKNGGTANNSEARENFLKALEYLRRGKVKDAKAYARKDGVADYFGLVPGLMTYKEFMDICAKNPECKKCVHGRVICKRCGGNSRQKRTCAACNQKGWTVCEACGGSPRRVHLSSVQTDTILRLQMLNAKDPQSKLSGKEADNSDWSRLLVPQQLHPVPVLSVQYLTEFDPRKCVFRRGKWIEPDGK